MSQQPPRQLRLDIPNTLNPTYSNAVVIANTPSEIIFDFIQIMPSDPRARVQSRVIMTPANAKLFLHALQTNLSKYEDKFGEIKTPTGSTTLADQLFGMVKPDDDAE
jgi:hypothetical protein